MFKALLLEEKDGKVAGRVTDLNEDSLPAGEVTVAVEYSTLNYKDGLILGGLGRLVRTATDTGMVVILDPRVLTKGYGRAFLDALPDCRRFVDGVPLG